MNLEVLQQPMYIPDLAPSYFHLSGPLKEALRGRKISSVDEVRDIVQEWLKAQQTPFHYMELGHLRTVGSDWLKSRDIA
jgi:hypothetical protein